MDLDKILNNIVECEMDLRVLDDRIASLVAPEDAQIAELKKQIGELEEKKKHKLSTQSDDGEHSLIVKRSLIIEDIDAHKILAVKLWPEEGGRKKVDNWSFSRSRRRHFLVKADRERDLLQHLLTMESPPFKPKYDNKALCDMIEKGLLPEGLGVVESNYHLVITRPKV